MKNILHHKKMRQQHIWQQSIRERSSFYWTEYAKNGIDEENRDRACEKALIKINFF